MIKICPIVVCPKTGIVINPLVELGLSSPTVLFSVCKEAEMVLYQLPWYSPWIGTVPRDKYMSWLWPNGLVVGIGSSRFFLSPMCFPCQSRKKICLLDHYPLIWGWRWSGVSRIWVTFYSCPRSCCFYCSISADISANDELYLLKNNFYYTNHSVIIV